MVLTSMSQTKNSTICDELATPQIEFSDARAAEGNTHHALIRDFSTSVQDESLQRWALHGEGEDGFIRKLQGNKDTSEGLGVRIQIELLDLVTISQDDVFHIGASHGYLNNRTIRHMAKERGVYAF